MHQQLLVFITNRNRQRGFCPGLWQAKAPGPALLSAGGVTKDNLGDEFS